MKIILLASLLAAVAACASDSQMVRERGVRYNEKGEKLVCERMMVTGSRLPVERCVTEAEAEAEREKAQAMVREGKIKGSLNAR
jgi:hypothetical protein